MCIRDRVYGSKYSGASAANFAVAAKHADRQNRPVKIRSGGYLVEIHPREAFKNGRRPWTSRSKLGEDIWNFVSNTKRRSTEIQGHRVILANNNAWKTRIQNHSARKLGKAGKLYGPPKGMRLKKNPSYFELRLISQSQFDSLPKGTLLKDDKGNYAVVGYHDIKPKALEGHDGFLNVGFPEDMLEKR